MELNWVEKHRPQTLDEILLDKSIKDNISEFIKSGNLCNLIFSGKEGIGKTSLAKIITKELNASVLYINAGYDGNIDMVRGKVKEFCEAIAIDGNLKIVILDEADALSGSGAGVGTGSSAQSALRNIIEEASDDTRFILTCNSLNKIIKPLQSRCKPIDICFSIHDSAKRVAEILKKEKIKYNKESFSNFIEKTVKRYHPDMRSIIRDLETWCVSGELKEYAAESQDLDKILDVIISEKDPVATRKHLIQNETQFNKNYIALAQALFNRLEDPTEMLVVADALYRMQIVADQEIEFAAMIIRLKS